MTYHINPGAQTVLNNMFTIESSLGEFINCSINTDKEASTISPAVITVLNNKVAEFVVSYTKYKALHDLPKFKGQVHQTLCLYALTHGLALQLQPFQQFIKRTHPEVADVIDAMSWCEGCNSYEQKERTQDFIKNSYPLHHKE